MSKRPAYQAGGCYHFYNRGAHRRSIFNEEETYLFVLWRVKQYSESLGLTLLAYCLLPNHYHFLVRQEGEQAAGLLPQRVFNSYSKAYNKRYQHSGTLFESNYKAIAVTNDAYILNLCRYIHANPVLHGLAEQVDDWPYSNYLEWIGERDGVLVDHSFVQSHFPGAGSYREFVAEYLEDRWLMGKLNVSLEDSDWV